MDQIVQTKPTANCLSDAEITRLYAPIWLELKAKKICIIEANPILFARIIKAVIKEKDQDKGFKLEASDLGEYPDKWRLKVKKLVKEKKIEFRLKRSLGL